jgi:phosphoribosylanthranilate isomerase
MFPRIAMQPVKIKVCGVTTADDVRMLSDAGVDAIGFNFYSKSPRYIEPSQAMALIAVLGPFTTPVGLFVDTPIRQATAIAYQLGLRAIQNYDDNPPGENLFPFAHLPAFRVKDVSCLLTIKEFVNYATRLNRRPAAVLLDSYVAGEMGGTGHVAPWNLLVGFDPGVPVILAGGLTPENVADAINLVRPWGIDVASGVESEPGKKDAAKVRRFVKNARGAISVS